MDPNRVAATDSFIKAQGIIPRSGWSAAADRIKDAPENGDWNYNTVVIHHSGRSGEVSPIIVQSKHMNKRGWDDVGYHFMIAPSGQIYEGRRLYYKGSHTENANTGKVGILIMGNFEREFLGLLGGSPAAAQLSAAKRLINGLKQQFPSLTILGGHKDFKAGTECPGNQLYPALNALRKDTGLAAPTR